jgi:hypothetical protein
MAQRPQVRNFVAPPYQAQAMQQQQRRTMTPQEAQAAGLVPAPTRLRPSQPEVQFSDLSQASFIEALRMAHANAGSWFNLSCALTQRMGKPMEIKKFMRWMKGNGPTVKTMNVVYPFLKELARQ